MSILRTAAIKLAFAVTRQHGLPKDMYNLADKVRIEAEADAFRSDAPLAAASRPEDDDPDCLCDPNFSHMKVDHTDYDYT